jgi:hypothetical protein
MERKMGKRKRLMLKNDGVTRKILMKRANGVKMKR